MSRESKHEEQLTELILERSRNLLIPEGQPLSDSWKGLRHAMSPKGNVLYLGPRAVAAGLLMLLATTLLYWAMPAPADQALHHTTAIAQQQVVYLPDSSKVTLQSSSSISYDPGSWEDSRSVALAGEAFFEVKKGSRFTVATEKGLVAVLGTSFTIHDRERLEVRCYTGKVAVDIINQERVLLRPGEGVQTGSGHETMSFVFNPAKKYTPTTYQFYQMSLKEVFDEVEKRSGFRVSGNFNQELRYTGTFTSAEIGEIMELICLPMGLGYEIEHKKKVVTVEPPF